MDTRFFEWVREHIADDPTRLRLKYRGTADGIDYAAAITQIECRRKFGKKIADTLASCHDFFFPSTLAGEQATSDIVATYHSSLIIADRPCVDLTAGLGIDALHSARVASTVTTIERDIEKVDALKHNAAAMSINNIDAICGDCIDYIDRCIANGTRFATAFIDPARRSGDGSRVFALADCEPDVVGLMPKLKQICDRLVIKASPMLDISHTIASLSPTPTAVKAVGTNTECKELLIIVDFRQEVTETSIEAVTISKDGSSETFTFTQSDEKNAPQSAVMTALNEGDYIYEASPALMKTGAFKVVANRYRLSIFHPNTRLFASSSEVTDFPGSRYRVLKVVDYASKNIKRFASEYPTINVAVRNFGIGADALRAKLRVRDGGNLRLYGITDANNQRILIVVE